MTYDGDDRECLDELALLACNDCLRMLSMGNKTIRHIFEEFCLVLQRASQIPTSLLLAHRCMEYRSSGFRHL
jgi:hypothetical protein